MSYLTKALRLDKQQMVDKIMSTKLTTFKPKFAMMHNTGAPSLKQWEEYSDVQKLAWGDNLNHYYKSMSWHSGPHACGTPEEYAYQLCDFAADGVHCSCFNRVSWGIETIGDFRTGNDDPNSVLGKASIDSTINILAAMHLLMNWNPGDYEYGVKGVHFHHECVKDHHACPGSLIVKSDIVARIEARMTEIKTGQTPIVIKTNVTPIVEPTHVDVEINPWPSKTAYPKFFSAMEEFYDAFLVEAKNLPNKNYIAVGATANAEAESDFELVVGDNDSAFGFDQWHNDRVERILKGCGINVKTAEPADQAKAVWWELNNSETKALEELKTVTNSYDAGALYCEYFERAGSPSAKEKRGTMAERTAAYMAARK